MSRKYVKSLNFIEIVGEPTCFKDLCGCNNSSKSIKYVKNLFVNNKQRNSLNFIVLKILFNILPYINILGQLDLKSN